jgi:hypothetical protein
MILIHTPASQPAPAIAGAAFFRRLTRKMPEKLTIVSLELKLFLSLQKETP